MLLAALIRVAKDDIEPFAETSADHPITNYSPQGHYVDPVAPEIA